MSNQILWDCHMHSSFSADSDTSMEDMILEAIRRGLHGICFTEHLDPDYPPTPDNETFELDLAGYQNTLYALRDKYRSELEIHYGIELGLQPHLEASFRELLETVPFDFVIGSSHVVHGYDPYYKEFFLRMQHPVLFPATSGQNVLCRQFFCAKRSGENSPDLLIYSRNLFVLTDSYIPSDIYLLLLQLPGPRGSPIPPETVPGAYLLP